MKSWQLKVLTMLAAVLAVSLPVDRAEAAFPGFNGAIAFTSIQNNADIWRMEADGFNPTRLTDSPYSDAHPAWSAEGTRIAFVSRRPDPGSSGVSDPEIWRMDASGNDETQLTNNLVDADIEPAWFPSDTRLAFTSNRPDAQNTTDWDIYVMSLDEHADPVGQPQRITSSTALDSQPAVSPDGKRIAFLSERDGDYEIYVIKAAPESATNKPIKLTNNTVWDNNPDWSPSGKKIVFESVRDGTDPEIVVMNSDGTGQRQLTKNEWNDMNPVFSPSGTRIAFESVRTYAMGIYRMRTDGTYQVNLMRRPFEDTDPSWQPVP